MEVVKEEKENTDPVEPDENDQVVIHQVFISLTFLVNFF